MSNFFVILALLVQLAVAAMAFIWTLAFLGFTDETKRSVSATILGKLLVTLCVLTAFIPIGLTFWLGSCYFASKDVWQTIPLGLFLPVVSIVACSLICAGLIYLFKKVGYSR